MKMYKRLSHCLDFTWRLVKGAKNRFLTLLSEFDIHYMYQDKAGQASENDFYNKIALVYVQVVM